VAADAIMSRRKLTRTPLIRSKTAVKWSEVFSKRVGTAWGLFGLLNVAGAIVDAFRRHSADFILPGMVIGGIWATIGFKRGLPVIPVSGSADVRLGLRAIRRRFLVMVLTALAWFPAAAIILPGVSPYAMPTAFFMTGLPLLLACAWWILSACPRCGEHFFGVGQFRGRFSFSRCQHCGLQMNDDSARPRRSLDGKG
jgi:hypothetical protein